LVRSLDSAPAAEKTLMIRALGASKKKKAVMVLLDRFDLKDGGGGDSADIVLALGIAERQEATDTLLKTWEQIDRMRLRSLGLSDPLKKLRVEILRALGRIADIKSIPVLRRGLLDSDSLVVEGSVAALGRLKDGRSIDWMVRLADSGNPDIAKASCEALGEIGGEKAKKALTRISGSSKHAGRVSAAYGLARLEERRGFLLLDGYLEEVEDPYGEGVLAAYYLARLGKTNGLDYLVGAAKMKASEFRPLAVEALGESKEPRAALPLTEFLSESDTNVRLMSVLALGNIGGLRAGRALKKVWKKDENRGVRAAARRALSGLGEYLPPKK
jgi:HEAT repeat protein